MLDAVIFDFDGVIVDSEPYHYRAFQSVLEPLGRGFDWEHYRAEYLGLDDRDAFRKAVPGPSEAAPGLASLVSQKTEAFMRSAGAGDIQPVPGTMEFIRRLDGRVPLALCSGGLRDEVLPVIGQLGLHDCFGAVVTAEDTAVSKPDPAPYRLALQRLGLTGTPRAAAIEDSNAGIASARSAGLRILALTTSHDRARLRGYHAVADSLNPFSLSRLEHELFGPHC